MRTQADWRAAIQRRWPLLWRSVVALALIAGVVAAWQLYNLAAYTDIERLLALGSELRQRPLAVPFIILLYMIAGVAFLPLTVMVVATILIYGPINGFLLANAGTLSTALTGYCLGSALGAEPLRRLGGRTLTRLNRHASAHGVMIVAALRIMPVAHFHAVSWLAGASVIRLRAYIAGTILGTAPGIAAIAAVGNQAKQLLLDPDTTGLMVLTALGVFSLLIFYYLRRWMRRYSPLRGEQKPSE